LITEDEKRRLSFEVWMETTESIATATWEKFDERNAVKIIIDSGGTRAYPGLFGAAQLLLRPPAVRQCVPEHSK
ncbi:MAG: hypothetical protein WBO94_00505, partial [Nitrospira sp.]